VRLITSLQVGAKYLGCVVCRFHVAAGAEATPYAGAINKFSGAVAKVSLQQPSEVVSLSYWSIKPWFLTEEKLTDMLIIPSSWGSQLVVNATHIKLFSGAITGEKEDFCMGSLSLPIFFTLLLFCLVS
jgi:hypothetical protein